jgi:hypothetical protein
MDENVEIVLFDRDPFNLELEGDGGKGGEVHVDLLSQFVQLIHRQQQGMEPGLILSLISTPQGFHRLIETEEPLVLSRVPDGFGRTSPDGHSQQQKPRNE